MADGNRNTTPSHANVAVHPRRGADPGVSRQDMIDLEQDWNALSKDAEAIRRDFLTVGKDLQIAVERYKAKKAGHRKGLPKRAR